MLPGQIIVNQQTIDIFLLGVAGFCAALFAGLTIWVRWYFGRFENRSKLEAADAMAKVEAERLEIQKQKDEAEENHKAQMDALQAKAESDKQRQENLDRLMANQDRLIDAILASTEAKYHADQLITAGIKDVKETLTLHGESVQELEGVIGAQGVAINQLRSTYDERNPRLFEQVRVNASKIDKLDAEMTEIRKMLTELPDCDLSKVETMIESVHQDVKRLLGEAA